MSTISEKRARLNGIDKELVDRANTITPQEEMPLLYEAMQLCEDLGLDRAWQRFKALQERLVRDGIEQAKKEQQN